MSSIENIFVQFFYMGTVFKQSVINANCLGFPIDNLSKFPAVWLINISRSKDFKYCEKYFPVICSIVTHTL